MILLRGKLYGIIDEITDTDKVRFRTGYGNSWHSGWSAMLYHFTMVCPD